MVLASLIALVALPFVALAAPARQQIPGLSLPAIQPFTNFGSCPVTADQLTFPANSSIAVPSGVAPLNVALGFGVQNYTCTNGTYASIGALATLVDISCLYGTPEFPKVQNDFFALPSFAQTAIANIVKKTPLLLGYHYFVTNPVSGVGISPKFAQAANGGAVFTTLAKAGSIHSPAGTSNVDWLQLSSIAGTWATTVFRVDTKAGQPPATCTGTGSISVPYAAKYWFFK